MASHHQALADATKAYWLTLDARPINRAAQQRAGATQRAAAIAALGMAPEVSSAYADRYAATTGELVKWANESVV